MKAANQMFHIYVEVPTEKQYVRVPTVYLKRLKKTSELSFPQ